MKKFKYDELEIVGFDETVKVICARSLPIVRHKQTDTFFLFSTGDSTAAQADILLTRSDVESWREEGRLTLLPAPLPAVPSAMIVYVASRLFNAAECAIPDTLDGEKLFWQVLPNETGDVWVTCASEKAVESLMNNWGRLLMEKATNLLVEFFFSNNPALREEAEEIAEMAKYPAREPLLRFRIYLRLSAALMFSEKSERLDNVYRIIRQMFPNLKWESFLVQLHHFVDILRIRAFSWNPPSSISHEIPPPPDMIQQNVQERILEQVSCISQIANKQDRLEQSRYTAEEYRTIFPIDKKLLNQIKEAMNQQETNELPWLYLNYEFISGLAGEPAFYYKGVVIKFGERSALNLVQFVRAVREYEEEGIHPGQLAGVLTATAGRRR